MAAECGTAGANRTDTVNGTAVAEENAGAGSIYRLTAEACSCGCRMKIQNGTVLCVVYKNGSYQNRLCLDAKENSRLNVLIVFRSGEDAQGTFLVQVKVQCGKGMQRYKLQEVQLLGAGYTCLSDIGASCGENATFELLKLELGAWQGLRGLPDRAGMEKRAHLTRRSGLLHQCKPEAGYELYSTPPRQKRQRVCGKSLAFCRDGFLQLFRGTYRFRAGMRRGKGN